MRSPLGDQSLAKIFSRRFEQDFPNFRGAVYFLEFPSRDDFEASKTGLDALIDRVAQRFKLRTAETTRQLFTFENALFNKLAKDLPSFEKDQLCAAWQSALQHTPTMTLYRPREGNPLENNNPPNLSSGPLAAIVGPDRYTPVGVMSGLKYYGHLLPSLSVHNNLDLLVRKHIYDHETGHALFCLLSLKRPENNLGRLFEEAVCDSYALLRHAMDGGKCERIGHFLSTTRNYMWTEIGDLLHYTTPTILQTMKEIEKNRLPTSPQALFDRAVEIASQKSLTTEMLDASLEISPQQRQKTHDDFHAFFKNLRPERVNAPKPR